MAFKDAKIGFHTSSTGHGGFVTVYDSTTAFASIRNNAYYATKPGKDSNENLTARRTYEALADFIEQQQALDGANGGVVAMVIGNNGGGHATRLWVENGIVKHGNGG